MQTLATLATATSVKTCCAAAVLGLLLSLAVVYC